MDTETASWTDKKIHEWRGGISLCHRSTRSSHQIFSSFSKHRYDRRFREKSLIRFRMFSSIPEQISSDDDEQKGIRSIGTEFEGGRSGCFERWADIGPQDSRNHCSAVSGWQESSYATRQSASYLIDLLNRWNANDDFRSTFRDLFHLDLFFCEDARVVCYCRTFSTVQFITFLCISKTEWN